MKDHQMNALVFDEAGQAENVLSLRRVDRPVLTGHQVLVSVLASPVNPSDLFFINGTYRFKPEFPQIAGMEATGIIEETPAGSALRQGMHVSFFSKNTWAEYVAVEESKLLVIPENLPEEKAAQLALNMMTAWGLMEAAGVSAEDWLLVTAGNSAVAKLIMQIAKHRNVYVIAAVRNEEQVEELYQYTDHVINITTSGFTEKITKITEEKGIHAMIDPVGGPTASALIKSLNLNGKVVFYGALSTQPVQFDNPDFVYRNISARGFGVLSFYQSKTPEQIRQITLELVNILSSEKSIVNVTKKYEFRKFIDALSEAKILKNGKVLFVPDYNVK